MYKRTDRRKLVTGQKRDSALPVSYRAATVRECPMAPRATFPRLQRSGPGQPFQLPVRAQGKGYRPGSMAYQEDEWRTPRPLTGSRMLQVSLAFSTRSTRTRHLAEQPSCSTKSDGFQFRNCNKISGVGGWERNS